MKITSMGHGLRVIDRVIQYAEKELQPEGYPESHRVWLKSTADLARSVKDYVLKKGKIFYSDGGVDNYYEIDSESEKLVRTISQMLADILGEEMERWAHKLPTF